jgi:colanic acid/amylovoran biosynthesis glycosyltransferase
VPLRIAYVLKGFPVVSQTFVASELVELRRRGIDVRVLSLNPPEQKLRHLFVARAKLEQLTDYGPEAIRRSIEQFRPHLFHAHFATEATGAARMLADERGVPFTFTAHGYDIHDRKPADLVERAAEAAAVVTVSKANAAVLVDAGVPQDKLRVIENGVDLSRFGDPAGEEREPGLIVCVARHVVVKGLGVLLEACALLRQRDVPYRCVLIGGGRAARKVAAARRRLGLEDRVELLGYRDHDEVLGWWRRAAVAAPPSVREGFPVCLLEAAASGVPAVASRVGGVPEIVEDGVTGLLVPNGDAAALADAIGRLFADPEEAERMGQAARARAEQRFSIREQVDSLVGMWSSIVEGG